MQISRLKTGFTSCLGSPAWIHKSVSRMGHHIKGSLQQGTSMIHIIASFDSISVLLKTCAVFTPNSDLDPIRNFCDTSEPLQMAIPVMYISHFHSRCRQPRPPRHFFLGLAASCWARCWSGCQLPSQILVWLLAAGLDAGPAAGCQAASQYDN